MTDKPTHEPPRLLPLRKAAAEIGIDERQLRNAIKEKLIPHYRLRKSRTLVSVQEVIAIMKSQGEEK